MNILKKSVLSFVFSFFFLLSFAFAQSNLPDSDPGQRPGDQKLPSPSYLPPEKKPEIITPPALPPVKKKKDLLSGPKVFVKKYIIEGNTVFSDKQLSKITKNYENKLISFEMLQELRLKLTKYYIDHGYINSGAIIPDQKVEDGKILIKIIEGKLVKIEITGNKSLKTSYIKARLALGAGPPLNINKLQEKVQLLHQNPLIKRINSELGPGIRLGEAVLKTRVVEANPIILGVDFNNHKSPRIGAERGEIYFIHQNFSGRGDKLGVRSGFTEGLAEITADYTIPVTPEDTTLGFRYNRSESKVVENPFDQINIRSTQETFGIMVSHPLIKTPSKEFSLSLNGEIRSGKTTLLGRPFSFSPGVIDGKSDITVIRFSQEWLSRDQNQVFAARSTFSLGLDLFGATINDGDVPDGEYFAWLGQFQWARRLGFIKGSQMIFRTDMQFANDSLLPMEQFSVGGARTVRGYRENQIVRDMGFVTSLEFRIPVIRIPIPGISKGINDGMLQIAPFIDWGWGENVDLPTIGPRTIGSAGFGLRWDPSVNIHAEIYWGFPFRDMDNPHKDLQDDGIHFQVSCRFL